jgi:hypothetical protein
LIQRNCESARLQIVRVFHQPITHYHNYITALCPAAIEMKRNCCW